MLFRLAVKVAVMSATAETVHGFVVAVHVVLLWVPLLVGRLQPPNPKLVPGVAVKVTCGTFRNVAVHCPGQLIPGGLLMTVPLPAPAMLTVSWETPGTKPWHPAKENTP